MTWRERGTYYGMGDGFPYTAVSAIQWPDRFRMEIENVFTIVVNGDRAWVKSPDGTRELRGEELAEQKEGLYVGWITTLVPLADKSFKLSLVGDAQVDSRT